MNHIILHYITIQNECILLFIIFHFCYTMQYVFTIQNECIQCIRCEINQNQTKMYSIKNAVENAGPPASVTKATRKCIINKNRIVFKMNVFNSFDVNSIKNVINKKCQTSLWKSTAFQMVSEQILICREVNSRLAAPCHRPTAQISGLG